MGDESASGYFKARISGEVGQRGAVGYKQLEHWDFFRTALAFVSVIKAEPSSEEGARRLSGWEPKRRPGLFRVPSENRCRAFFVLRL